MIHTVVASFGRTKTVYFLLGWIGRATSSGAEKACPFGERAIGGFWSLAMRAGLRWAAGVGPAGGAGRGERR